MSNIYSRLKIFHYTDKLDTLPKDNEEIKAPLHIRVKPTNICNHNCYYCAYRVESLQLGKDMAVRDSIPEPKMMELIDDWVDMGVKAVTFSGGGEPFCYPHFLKTVKRLAQTPIKFATLTNGSRLTGEIADMFAGYGTWLRISIDGWDDDSYSRYRGVPNGEFSRVMENMAGFKKLQGKCVLGVSVVLDTKNACHIYDFINRIKQTGVDSVKVSACIVDNDAEVNNRYHQPVFKETKALIQKAKSDFEDSDFIVYDTYHELDDKFGKSYSWCPYLQVLPVIGADLNVYSCQDKAYNLDEGLIGSIRDTSFKEFWFDGKEKFFRIDPSRHCRHHCVANEKNKMVLDYLNSVNEHMGFV